MRRIRGTTQREDRKQLGIKSLGQESEVIVLRDVPDRPKPKYQGVKVINFQATADSAHSMTAEEIEALFKRQKPAKRDEVEEAISDLRPREEVLSRKEFDQGLSALTKGFSKSQLKNYLHRHTPKKSPHAQPQAESVTDVRKGDVRYLEKTKWSPGVTDVNKKVAGGARSSSTSADPSSSKQNIAASIYRVAWNVRVYEEATTEGELDLLLTPEQWALLHTRAATRLFSVLRARKFYRNSRFERIREKGIIRVIGPKGEADDIALLFISAFQYASTQIVDLDTFRHESSHTHSQNLSSVYTPTQLEAIMNLTKTYVVFDAETSKLSIYAFTQDKIDSALRLLIALLRLPVPRVVKNFIGDHADIGLAPTYIAKTLPSSIRAIRLGRWTASVMSNFSPSSPGREGMQEGDGTDFDATPESTVVRLGTRNPPDAILQGPVLRSLIKHMEQYRSDVMAELPVPAHVDGSYWVPQIVSPPWKATMGYVLHDIESSETTNNHEAQSEGSSIKMTPTASTVTQRPNLESNKVTIFSPQAPGLTKALAYWDYASHRRQQTTKILPSQLIVRLIPSPLSAADMSKLNKLPPINIVLNVATLSPTSVATERPATKSKNQWSFPVDDRTVVKVIGINAALMEVHYYVSLPDQNVDLRFSKHWNITASQVDAFDDPAMRTFITTVIESIKSGDELKAPQTVDIKLPSWMIRNSKSSGAPEVSTHSYFFAGFEHRGRNQFSPGRAMKQIAPELTNNYILSVNAIEGGFSGGRQIEASILPSPALDKDVARNDRITKEADTVTDASSADDTKATDTQSYQDAKMLINAAEAMVRLLSDAQTGALPSKSHTPQAVSLDRDVSKYVEAESEQE
ncbi:hypothetical protein MBLNU457_6229t1 [Dothideomycetes sp. NU457]